MDTRDGTEFDIESIEKYITNQSNNPVESLTAVISRFDEKEETGVAFLRILLYETLVKSENGREAAHAVLESIVSHTLSRKDSHALKLADLLPFCYAIVKLSGAHKFDIRSDRFQLVLRRNFPQIILYFDPKKFPILVPKDENGRPPPPAPKSKAHGMMRPERSHTQVSKERKRALPGYTPAFLAAQYAQKHNL